ncbi:MAG: alpha/beta hydrolase [Myxococcota bacterium]
MRIPSLQKWMKYGSHAVLATSLGACGTSIAAETPSPETSTETASVVLVHGAFADGSAWNKVIPILQEAGVEVAAAQLPLSSLADDAAAATRLIDLQASPVVLVGHSWGGAVITEAGAHENVEALVYVAAFAPDADQPVGGLLEGLPPAPWQEELIPDAGGNLRLSANAMSTYFAPDLPASETAVMAATQGPINAETFEQAPTTAAWRDKPTHYVISDDDKIIPTPLQVSMAETISAETTTLLASHVPMLSKPEEVAQIILDVVAEVSAGD